MPNENDPLHNVQGRQSRQIAFLADRCALLLYELVDQNMTYGQWCFDDWFESKFAEIKRNKRQYEICKDMVRLMLRHHLKREAENENEEEASG